MTSWQALCALVSAIAFDDPVKNWSTHCRTRLVCLIVKSHKIAKKNFQTTDTNQQRFCFYGTFGWSQRIFVITSCVKLTGGHIWTSGTRISGL